MAQSVVNIQGYFDSIPSGAGSIALAITNTTPPDHREQIVLASGDNTITVPALSDGVLIIPDSTSTVTKTLKGDTGDTGVEVSPTKPTLLTWPSTPPASFILTTNGADTGKYTTFLFF